MSGHNLTVHTTSNISTMCIDADMRRSASLDKLLMRADAAAGIYKMLPYVPLSKRLCSTRK